MINYPLKIILHHSLTKDSRTVSWDAIRNYHRDVLGWRDIGYHFGIEMVGGRYEILTGRMMTEKGAHTKGQNDSSIGICLIGNFDSWEVPDAQWRLAVRFVRSLIQIFEMGPGDVYGHREFADYKSCPGTRFNLDKFRGSL